MSPHKSVLDVCPVIPVVTLDRTQDAVPLAQALLTGGIAIIEVTLRTAAALDAVRAIADEVPQIVLGAGSVLDPAQADAALEAGASFLVSPGAGPELLAHLVGLDVPVLPGVATVSEALAAAELGLHDLKFFPAGPAGGPSYLRAIAAPVPQIRFCPTGGVSPDNLREYLDCPNVVAVGGSWLAPAEIQLAGDWDTVSSRARAALASATRTGQA